ncbi:hypothetical protein [Pseudomonas alabamensis]|uniref:hypothetical protein n=1 Tax=Pseudomonas alabamensis TaxID=3064349 RepID=UPI003F654571
MQPTPPASTGKLLGSYGYGKALIISLLVLGTVFFALALFVGYLSVASSVNFNGPKSMLYATAAFLALLGAVMFALAQWQKKLRVRCTKRAFARSSAASATTCRSAKWTMSTCSPRARPPWPG